MRYIEPPVSEAIRGQERWLRENFLPALDQKTYELEQKQVGLMPLLMQVLHNNYTDGIRSIGFELRERKLYVKLWEGEEEKLLPVGFGRAAEAELCVPGLTDLTMWDMLNVENLYSAAVEQVSESGEPTFSIAYPGREGTFIVSDGSISLPADGLVLSCRAYNVFEASYRPLPHSAGARN